jgi:hypothetical protein
MGLRSIFRLFLPLGSAVIGINKRKIVLCHKSAQQLNNFAQMVQMLKKPAKFYRQGISLRFRIRKMQNFRHKKRK